MIKNEFSTPGNQSGKQQTTRRRGILDALLLPEFLVGLTGLVIIGICILVETETAKQSVVFNSVFIAGALALLLGASNLVLEYAVKLAHRLHISEFIIGLTIVSIGTSIPEMFTAVASAQRGVGSFVVGDIYGSYLTQLTLFLGFVVILLPTRVNREVVPNSRRDGGFMLAAMGFLSLNILDGQLTRGEAIESISIFCIYLIFLYASRAKIDVDDLLLTTAMVVSFTDGPVGKVTRPGDAEERVVLAQEVEGTNRYTEATGYTECNNDQVQKGRVALLAARDLGMILVGALLCYLGAHYVVYSGTNIALVLGMPDHVVGATIVGFGTGFPEFVVSMMAVRKKKYVIAFGNLIGSNIVDPLLSISLGVLVREISLTPEAVVGILGTMLPLVVVVDLLIIYMFTRQRTSRLLGVCFGLGLVTIYGVFLARLLGT